MGNFKLFFCALFISIISPAMAFAGQCFGSAPLRDDFNTSGMIGAVQTVMADFNRDNSIGFDDFFLFADVFGQNVGENEESGRFDLNGDDKITWEDLFIFADSFGRSITVETQDRVVRLSSDQIPIEVFDEQKLSSTLRCVFTQLRAAKSAGYYYSSRSLKEAGQPFASVLITAAGDSVIRNLKVKWTVSGPDKDGRYTMDLPLRVIAELSLSRDILRVEALHDILIIREPGERRSY